MGLVLSNETNGAWRSWAGGSVLPYELGLGMEHRQRPRLRLEPRAEVDTKLKVEDSGNVGVWQGIPFSLDRVLRCLFLVSDADVLLQWSAW